MYFLFSSYYNCHCDNGILHLCLSFQFYVLQQYNHPPFVTAELVCQVLSINRVHVCMYVCDTTSSHTG